MAIKPEERPKLIGLVVALIGVVAYVLLVVVPKITASAAPAPRPDGPPALTAASAGTSGAGGAGSSEASGALPDEDIAPIPPSPKRDTFTPPSASGHASPQAQAKPVQTVPHPVGPVLPGGPGAGLVPVGVAPAPVLPPIELKGVILGDPAIAVLSVSGEVVQRQVGDTIAPGLKLESITDAGISVQEGNKRVSITVGHMMANAAPQAQLPAAPAVMAKAPP